MNIWLLVTLSIALVLGCILIARLHAFLTLLLAGLLVAALAGEDAVRNYTVFKIEKGKMTQAEASKLQSQTAATRLATAFGETAGKIGILIALASIIGQCLLESRAASVIVDRMLQFTGPKRAPEAMAASSFVLGIPVFFDTVFYLMVPLARSLRQRLGKDYVLFILAIFAGGSIAHSLVPPTPGPLLVAEIIGVEIGTMIIAGLIIGSCSSAVSLFVARIINSKIDVPLRNSDDAPAGDQDPATATTAGLPITDGPSLFRSLIPIVIPIAMIAIGSVASYLIDSGSIQSNSVIDVIQSLGDKNIALAVGVVFALSLTSYCSAEKRTSLVTRSLASGGNIILITSAGGALGAMLRQAGIEQAVGSMAHGVPGLMLLPLAFAVTASIRTLQGSATVAMITAAGVLQGFVQQDALPFHPVYMAMAIGAGSKPISWMTDSGFWVITRMSGMTESEGLRTVSPMSVALGGSALAFTMLLALIYPGV